ncbi:SusC/RagA family TonB-linked outer membrane protein [Terrimonas pollutisoli]|uniref:SusC/RagA family TonB-linked outer membrane protein n=1 Tax=Terrimonas pollutisoli TaxID=3034147 RepID=UPI0023EAF7C5|nr:SusC/RagA family TonB-linked outer membrane protein [Terrimonas sp. H1YJ31]
MRKIASLIAMLMLFHALAFAQTRTVTGQVKDSKGDPVPFANITVKGTNTGVAADVNGNFSIDVKQGESLLVSSASFAEQEVKLGTSTTLTVTLQPQGNLQEVVVTALGLRRTRNQVPFAAQQIKGDEVSKTRTANFVQNLSGKVAGLDIKQNNTLGGSTNVVIRGNKSITGNNQALFVVDGVPFNNAITNTRNQRTGRGGYDFGSAAADINPDDIESITVLKGAAASALYGSQGANGVILITTKKAVRGLGITVNSGFSVGAIDKKTFPKYQKEYGGGYGAFYEDPTHFFLYRDIDGDGTEDLVTPLDADASYGGRFDPNLMVYQWDAFDPSSANFGKQRPWVAAANDPVEFFEKSFSSNQSIFIDGASDKGTFKLGYTRNDDQGIIPLSKISKNLINLGGTYKVTDKLTAGATINFSNIKGKGRYGTGYESSVNQMMSFRQWWQTNVDIKEQKAAYFRERKNVTWNWSDPGNLTPIYWNNVYFTLYENYPTDDRNRYFGNVNANYKITDWFTISGRASLDAYDEIQEERIAVGSVTDSRLDAPSGYIRFNRSVREALYNLLANVDKDVTTDINIKGVLGAGLRKEYTSTIRVETNGGLIVPKVYSLSNSLNTPNAPEEFEGRREVQGVFAGATFSWRDMITLDGTIRRDASSTLPKGNNVYYYPSGSVGFVFSKLLPAAKWLSYGKLRANYAQVGNDAPLYSVLDVYAFIPPFSGNPQSSVVGTKNNPDLVPERTRSYEAGLEMAFINNRVGFDISYYKAKTIDQIIPVVVSTATGYNSKFLNAGTIENKGVEVSLNGSPVSTKDFSWNVNVNWARNRNKVTELFEGADNLVLADFQGGISLNATLNHAFGTIRGENFVYTNGQKTIGANGRYKLSPTSNEVIGDPNPDWVGGINNTLRYKNLSLSFLIDMKKGGDVFSLDLYYGMGSGMYPETAGLNDLGNPSRNTIANGGGIILPGVKEDGKPNDIRVSNTNYGSYGGYGPRRMPAANFVYDAGYVKLREATINYSLPKELISKLKPFKGIDVSLIGRNLWIIDKDLPYADPEDNLSAGNLQGYQSGSYPTIRTFTLNLKLNF